MAERKKAKTITGLVTIFGTSPLPWRVGRQVGRTIYDANDKLIGMMDRPQDALGIVIVANATLDKKKGGRRG